MGFHRQRTMWLWRNPDNVTHRQLLSIDQVWRRSTALTWSRWGCHRLADNIWLLAHDNNNNKSIGSWLQSEIAISRWLAMSPLQQCTHCHSLICVLECIRVFLLLMRYISVHLLTYLLYLLTYVFVQPRAGSGVVRMDPLHFLAGCRTRRLTPNLFILPCSTTVTHLTLTLPINQSYFICQHEELHKTVLLI